MIRKEELTYYSASSRDSKFCVSCASDQFASTPLMQMRQAEHERIFNNPGDMSRTLPTQFAKKGSKKKGTFIGDPKKIHLHLDIGQNDHLIINGDRYNLMKGKGYDAGRIQKALDALTNQYANVSGYQECRTKLQELLN